MAAEGKTRSGRLFLDDPDGDLLGRRVCAWLAMHRVQARDLAEAVGTDKYGLSRALHGRRSWPLDLALRVCEWTGIAINGDSVRFDPGSARGTRPGCGQ